MSDVFDDGQRLFLRSVFPGPVEVKPGDATSRGVALRTSGEEILVHPYFLRHVCRNGAIAAQAVRTCRVERYEYETCPGAEEAVLVEVRRAVRECSDEKILVEATGRMRAMTDRAADMALSFLPEIIKMPREQAAQWFDAVQGRYERRTDRSLYGLMNAITSVARDTSDHDTRWRLEEAGGGMLARLLPAPAPGDAPAELMLV
ncbi:MAG: hypothetical protein ACYSU7_10305 [Planctomycetota bacterium]